MKPVCAVVIKIQFGQKLFFSFQKQDTNGWQKLSFVVHLKDEADDTF